MANIIHERIFFFVRKVGSQNVGLPFVWIHPSIQYLVYDDAYPRISAATIVCTSIFYGFRFYCRPSLNDWRRMTTVAHWRRYIRFYMKCANRVQMREDLVDVLHSRFVWRVVDVVASWRRSALLNAQSIALGREWKQTTYGTPGGA